MVALGRGLHRRGLLVERARLALDRLHNCDLCARYCRIDRFETIRGAVTAVVAGLGLRVGIATGPVVAGVIGRRKFSYDLWGDTVNTASRLEAYAPVGGIQVTERTYRRLRDRYAFECRRGVPIKGKGSMTTYVLLPLPRTADAALQQLEAP